MFYWVVDERYYASIVFLVLEFYFEPLGCRVVLSRNDALNQVMIRRTLFALEPCNC